MVLLDERQDMSAIEVDEATQELNRVDASDIETARNIGLEDDMFAPVAENQLEESGSRMAKNPNTVGAQMDMMSNDGDSILHEMEDSVDDLGNDPQIAV